VSVVRRFWSLPADERALVAFAGFLLVTTRALVHVECVPKIRTVLRRLASSPFARTPGFTAARIGRTVTATRRHMPWTDTCLSESLVTEALLSANGHPTELFIGIKRGPGGVVEAHAWVKSGGKKVVCGARQRSGYETLWSSKSARPVRPVRGAAATRLKMAV